MKYLLAIILVGFGPLNDLDRIATINALKEEARIAYTNGDYEKALKNYKYLIDSMEVNDDNVLLNLANAYYQLKDTTNAVDSYQMLLDSESNTVRSVAQQQLGVMANKSKKFDQALEHFKEAIKANPANDDARYNYELLKKVLQEQEQQQKKDQKQQNKDEQQKNNKEEQKDQQQQQKNKEQQQREKEQQQEQQEGEGKEQEKQDPQDQQKGEKKDGEEQEQKQQKPQDGEESDEKNQNKQDQMSSLSDKLKEMKISEEKARMILQALRNKEIQYYQQNKRKAKNPKDTDKPDW